MIESDVSALLAQVNTLGNSLLTASRQDAKTRKKLCIAARDLSRAMEEPGDIVERVCFSFMEEVSIRIAIDLDLFNILIKRGTQQTLEGLAKVTGAEEVLLARLLRSLGSVGAVGEVGEMGKEAYTATKVTRTFANPELAAGVKFCLDVLSPSWNNLPGCLRKAGYRNPFDRTNAALHLAQNATGTLESFVAAKLDFRRSFQLYMSIFNEGRSSWTDYYPVQEQIGKGARLDPRLVLFVDVGGGLEQEGLALRKRYPDLPGRFMIQDLPQIVSGQKADGVQFMAHDIFAVQPVKGARVYYLRNVLRGWNDELCHTILQHIRDAMNLSYSKVLINQWLVPTRGGTSLMTHSDLNMMATGSSMERTEKQTRDLLEGAGLCVVRVWRPQDLESECIVEAVAK